MVRKSVGSEVGFPKQTIKEVMREVGATNANDLLPKLRELNAIHIKT